MQTQRVRSRARLDQLDALYEDAVAALRALAAHARSSGLPAQDVDRHFATIRALLREQDAALREVYAAVRALHAGRQQVAARLAGEAFHTRRGRDGLSDMGE